MLFIVCAIIWHAILGEKFSCFMQTADYLAIIGHSSKATIGTLFSGQSCLRYHLRPLLQGGDQCLGVVSERYAYCLELHDMLGSFESNRKLLKTRCEWNS